MLAPTTESPMVAIARALHAQHVKVASDAWTAAMRAVLANQSDPDRQIVSLILAAEQVEDAAKHAASTLRSTLVESMQRDGVMSFETDHHTISRCSPRRSVDITDMRAFIAAHPELMTTPKPQPDKTEIGKRLRAGERIAGAVLDNGGAETLRISSKKG